MSAHRLHLTPDQFMLCIQVLRADRLDDVVQAYVEYQVQKQGNIMAASRVLGVAPATIKRRVRSPRKWTPPTKEET